MRTAPRIEGHREALVSVAINSLAWRPIFSALSMKVSRLYKFSDDELKLFENDNAAEELTVAEYESYLEREFDRKAIAILKKHSLVGISFKKENGGRGASPIAAVLASERLSQAGLGANSAIGCYTGLAGSCIETWGSSEQKKRYLAPAAKGDMPLAYALNEPESRSDSESLQATFEGEEWRVRSQQDQVAYNKRSIADAVVTFAYPKGKQSEGVSAFVVDTKSEGFEVAMKLKEKLGSSPPTPQWLNSTTYNYPRRISLAFQGRDSGLPMLRSSAAAWASPPAA